MMADVKADNVGIDELKKGFAHFVKKEKQIILESQKK